MMVYQAPTQTALAILGNVRTLLGDKSKWTTGATARDRYGRSADPESPLAAKWCASGAIQRCAIEMNAPYKHRSEAEVLLTRHLGPGRSTVAATNDGPNGYRRIMEALERLTSPWWQEPILRRSAAAMKGWETRRKRMAQEAQTPPPSPPMVISQPTRVEAPVAPQPDRVRA